jgi:hypothetical protein
MGGAPRAEARSAVTSTDEEACAKLSGVPPDPAAIISEDSPLLETSIAATVNPMILCMTTPFMGPQTAAV